MSNYQQIDHTDYLYTSAVATIGEAHWSDIVDETKLKNPGP